MVLCPLNLSSVQWGEKRNLRPISIGVILLTGITTAGLAQSVERQALNLMVEGSSPSFGVLFPGVLIFFVGIATTHNGTSYSCVAPISPRKYIFADFKLFRSITAAETSLIVHLSSSHYILHCIRQSISYFICFKGSCIDVFAPGFDILSVCASNVCKDSTSYMVMSGTHQCSLLLSSFDTMYTTC